MFDYFVCLGDFIIRIMKNVNDNSILIKILFIINILFEWFICVFIEFIIEFVFIFVKIWIIF